MCQFRRWIAAAVAVWVCPAGAPAQKAPEPGAAIIAAARRGDLPGVKALLAGGVSVDAKGRREMTALMAAVTEGHSRVAEALLRAGANPNARTTHPRADWTGATPLAWAATNGRTDCVRILLAHGAAVDARTLDRKTPLMLAAMWGYTACVRILLAGGARRDLTDADGLTALALARRGDSPIGLRNPNGHVECIRLLAPADRTPTRGRTGR